MKMRGEIRGLIVFGKDLITLHFRIGQVHKYISYLMERKI